ncbi:cobalamin-binding protein, partial [Candidatus Bathyarchaeota archaeon]|nr:cobalamin-binding protein [Candidatus Bathyarchaeota archaeon]
VHDIGCDASTSEFVKKVKEVNPDIIGMSALLTTTMPKMTEV